MARFSLADITIDGEYAVDVLKSINSCCKVNEHGLLYYEGYISGERANQLRHNHDENSKVKVFTNAKHIFTGIVMHCEIEETSIDSFYMRILLNTCSKKADYNKQMRFFQDKAQTFASTIKEAFNNSNDGSILISTIEDKKIKNPILQYNETDWDFAKRMAGYAGTILVVNELADNPEIILGIPRRKQLVISENTIYQSQQTKRYNNNTSRASKNSSNGYILSSTEDYAIGDMVFYKGLEWLVVKKEFVTEGAFVEGLYTLGKYEYYCLKKQENKKIIGLELKGKVLSCSGIEIRVELDIDEQRSNKCDYWYTYEPISNNGMYSMPLEGEKIMLQWQSNDDADAVGSYCYRLNSDGLPDSSHKYMKTNHDVEMSFLPSCVTFAMPNHSIRLQDGDISMETSSNIYASIGGILNSKSSGKTTVQSSEQISIIATKKQSAIVMQLQNIDIVSKEKTTIKTDPKGKKTTKISRAKMTASSVPTSTAASILSSIPSKEK